MSRYSHRLDNDLNMLSLGYSLSISDDLEWVTVHDFKLPPSYNYSYTDILIELPADYPLSPPGVGSHIYTDPDLRFRGRKLEDLHENVNPGWGNWAWLCYEWINWDPNTDDLVKFMEMVRSDLTKLKTK